MAGRYEDYMRVHMIDLATSASWYAQNLVIRGAYMQALITSWLNDGLDADLDVMREEVEPFLDGGKTTWEDVRTFLARQFPEAEDGKRRNRRQEKERKYRDDKIEKRRKAARSRWDKPRETF